MADSFGLYLVLTSPLTGYEACTEAAVAEGVRYVQLRMKHRPPAEVRAMAHRLRAMTRRTATRFIVNDDLQVAMDVDADGVHLGQSDMSVVEAQRRWAVPGKTFGLSTHDEAQEQGARELAVDYIGVGPVHATPTKELPDPVLGPDRAAAIVRASPLTSVAIGGIDSTNLAGLLALGVVNFAVVRAVCAEPDPGRAIRELQAIWRAALLASRP